MPALTNQTEAGEKTTILSVDAMGGDHGPSVVVAGLSNAASQHTELGFILHGDRTELLPLVAQSKILTGRCDIRDAKGVVIMTDKPSQVIRTGKNTSMWSALESVRSGEASGCISCGNTGALMALGMIRLRKLPGVDRPAIAVLWPSRNPQGYNVMLDVGADIRADAEDLMQYAVMGACYARIGSNIDRPRIGLLNVGVEEHKGRAELHAAHKLIAGGTENGNYDFLGFVEGGDIPGASVDVIVTDGFTGNIALKTGEGTASLIGDFLKQAFRYSIFSRIASALALSSLRRLSRRIDPRSVNGGVFLGLNGTVVKSHGSADATGVAAAVNLAFQLSKSDFNNELATRLASSADAAHSATAIETELKIDMKT
jgi:glycerol-3-phosphate acyltransferase PlsX